MSHTLFTWSHFVLKIILQTCYCFHFKVEKVEVQRNLQKSICLRFNSPGFCLFFLFLPLSLPSFLPSPPSLCCAVSGVGLSREDVLETLGHFLAPRCPRDYVEEPLDGQLSWKLRPSLPLLHHLTFSWEPVLLSPHVAIKLNFWSFPKHSWFISSRFQGFSHVLLAKMLRYFFFLRLKNKVL